jgi:6-phosphogluconolactonase (cycloisomerase 2 family)
MLYTVKACKTNRFVVWCSETWYEASKEEKFIYTKEQTQEVIRQMRKHYQYVFDVIGEDGSVEHIDTLKKKVEAPKPLTFEEKKKKLFTINANLLKKSGRKFCSFA